MADQYINKVIYYGETLIDLTGDDIAASDVLRGKKAHLPSGEPIAGTCDYDADTSDATAMSSEILLNKTAYRNGEKLTGIMPNNGGVAGTISTVAGEYTVPQGYHDGSGKVGIDATEQSKIVASNIREGVEILGVTGTMSGTSGVTAQTKVATPTTTQQVITPDAAQGYNYLSQVTIDAIPRVETDNMAGGKSVIIG